MFHLYHIVFWEWKCSMDPSTIFQSPTLPFLADSWFARNFRNFTMRIDATIVPCNPWEMKMFNHPISFQSTLPSLADSWFALRCVCSRRRARLLLERSWLRHSRHSRRWEKQRTACADRRSISWVIDLEERVTHDTSGFCYFPFQANEMFVAIVWP